MTAPASAADATPVAEKYREIAGSADLLVVRAVLAGDETVTRRTPR